MWDLAMSVLFSSILFVIFKLFSVFRIETKYAIIANYFVAGICSTLFYTGSISIGQITHKPWFLGTIALGVLFILVFNIMAKTSQDLGVSVASVATKMSFVIPVLFGVFLYKEVLNGAKTLGIFLAIAAVYLSAYRDQRVAFTTKVLLLPMLVFLGSGMIDAGIKYLQEQQMEVSDYPLFTTVVFFSAAATGCISILIKINKNAIRVNLKNLVGGILLGIPNYFSIYFLMRALKSDVLQSASLFTVNNVAIVLVSTFFAIILFKEKLNLPNWMGILLAVISILLVLLF